MDAMEKQSLGASYRPFRKQEWSMKEFEAHELEHTIQQEAPFFETTILPLSTYDEYAESACGAYKVVMMTDTFSLEVHLFDDWIRLLGQIQQISGTKELTAAALDVWMQAESEKAAATERDYPDRVMTDERLEEEATSEDDLWSVVYNDDPVVYKK